VRKLVYESDFSEEDAQRMQNSETTVGQAPAVDTQLARKDLVLKLLAKLSNEDRSLLLLKEVEGHSVEELSQMTADDRHERKYNKGKIVSGPAEAFEGGAAFDARRALAWLM
jgi:hypothetical protein